MQSLDSIGKSKSTSFGKDRDNIHKNRYKNTVPCTVDNNLSMKIYSFFTDDDNRIMLDEVEGLSIPETDYINASYIDVRMAALHCNRNHKKLCTGVS